MKIHEERMLELIDFTRNNSNVEPYGCSIYNTNGEMLVSVTGNKLSPINHAEILAINECAKIFPNIDWTTLTLYTTGEPCCMCASACCWANLNKVVYGTNIPFMINLWGIESSIRANEVIKLHPKAPEVIEDISMAECNALFLECEHKFAKIWNDKRWALNTRSMGQDNV